MLGLVKSFLSGRTFRVKFGAVISDPFNQENGVPQGGVLSVTLFIIKLNTITEQIPPYLQYSLYVDDIQISYTSCNISLCERKLQLGINRMTAWANRNGFKFSPEKTVCVPFSLRRGLMLEPSLHMGREEIPVHTQHKFLGVIYDKKLTFKSHIDHLKKKCLSSMSILKLLSHKSWGSDRICLLRLYNALIRSQLDYACFVYASARKSTLRILNPIHHLGLRLCTGAFRTSPIQSLYAESNQWPLEKRRTFLGASYVLRTSAVPNHPCYNLLTGPQHERLFNNKPRVIPRSL